MLIYYSLSRQISPWTVTPFDSCVKKPPNHTSKILSLHYVLHASDSPIAHDYLQPISKADFVMILLIPWCPIIFCLPDTRFSYSNSVCGVTLVKPRLCHFCFLSHHTTIIVKFLFFQGFPCKFILFETFSKP